MVILVTGTSSGFGAAIFSHLKSLGHTVYGSSRRPSSDDMMFELDVRDAEAAESVVRSIVDKEGRIDVLINNAGMGIGGAAELASVDEVEVQMGTNFIGCTNMCRAVLPYMRRQHSGRIINMSSIAGRFAVPYQGLYSASKFAIEGYSQALAIETSGFGIKVVVVNPGDFSTGFTRSRKVSDISLGDADYGESFKRVLAKVEHDELGGGTPDMLARKIGDIIAAKRPRFHYVVAKDPIQKVVVFISAVLPDRLFHRALRWFYNV